MVCFFIIIIIILLGGEKALSQIYINFLVICMWFGYNNNDVNTLIHKKNMKSNVKINWNAKKKSWINSRIILCNICGWVLDVCSAEGCVRKAISIIMNHFHCARKVEEIYCEWHGMKSSYKSNSFLQFYAKIIKKKMWSW
jgi:hypothetical protein